MKDWIQLNLPYWSCNGDSFSSLRLNQPGVLISTDKGDFLIGHINPERGICDDCTKFDDETIVKKYKIIWEEGT